MATLKLGSTTAMSESGGAITYDAGTIGGNIVFPAGHIIKKTKLFGMTSDFNLTNSITNTNWWPTSGANTTYTPDGGSGNNSTIHCYVHVRGFFKQQANHDGRGYAQYKISGNNITNVDVGLDYIGGTYDYGGSGHWTAICYVKALPPVTLDGNGNGALSFEFYHRSSAPAHSDQQWGVWANGTGDETHLEIIEVQ